MWPFLLVCTVHIHFNSYLFIFTSARFAFSVDRPFCPVAKLMCLSVWFGHLSCCLVHIQFFYLSLGISFDGAPFSLMFSQVLRIKILALPYLRYFLQRIIFYFYSFFVPISFSISHLYGCSLSEKDGKKWPTLPIQGRFNQSNKAPKKTFATTYWFIYGKPPSDDPSACFFLSSRVRSVRCRGENFSQNFTLNNHHNKCQTTLHESNASR